MLQVKDIQRKLKVSREKLKFYERKKLIKPLRRSASGYRQYSPSIVDQLRFIEEAQNLGFTLKEIATLMALGAGAPTNRQAWTKQAQLKIQSLELRITRLTRMKDTLKEYLDDPASWENDPECSTLFNSLKKG